MRIPSIVLKFLLTAGYVLALPHAPSDDIVSTLNDGHPAGYLSARSPAWAIDSHMNDLDERIVINPPITRPNASTVWRTGQANISVTWDVPEGAAGYRGNLLLGWLFANYTQDPNEHLFHNPLASGFYLTDGNVTFDLPCNESIVTRDSYIVVLMGDSGNRSPPFTIIADDALCASVESTSNGGNIASAEAVVRFDS